MDSFLKIVKFKLYKEMNYGQQKIKKSFLGKERRRENS